MKNSWLWTFILVALLAGCSTSDATPPTQKTSEQKRSRAEHVVVKNVRMDEFGLPLEIQIDAPEPPKEIVGPSPPIKSDKPAKAKSSKAV